MRMTRWRKSQVAGIFIVAMLTTATPIRVHSYDVAVGGAASAPPAVPEAMSYTGQLRVDGALYTGDTLWRFAVVTSTGGVLWTNDGSATLPPTSGVMRKVAAGRVGIALGEKASPVEAMQPLPSGVFAAPQTYLRAWVAAPTTAQPEELVAAETPVPHAQAFTSVPYSHRAARASQADVAGSLAPAVPGQPIEVHGDLVVHGRIQEDNRVGATSSSPAEKEEEGDDDHDKRGRVTFDTVTTRHLIVTDSVSLPGGSVFTSTVTQVQTMVVVGTATVGTQLRVGTGTVVIDAPGNTITFDTANGTVQTTAANALLLNPSNAGNVGIGTSAPGARLEVNQTDDSNTTTALRVRTGAGTTASDKFLVDGAGNVTISGAGDVVGPNLLLRLRNTTSGAQWNLGLNGSNANNFELTADGRPRLFIDRFSDLTGIGASPAGAELHVAHLGTTRLRLQDDNLNGTGGIWEFATVNAVGGARAAIRQVTPGIPSETVAERFTILPGGKVGIGTASPEAELDVAGRVILRQGSGGIGQLFFQGGTQSLVQTEANKPLTITAGLQGPAKLTLEGNPVDVPGILTAGQLQAGSVSATNMTASGGVATNALQVNGNATITQTATINQGATIGGDTQLGNATISGNVTMGGDQVVMSSRSSLEGVPLLFQTAGGGDPFVGNYFIDYGRAGLGNFPLLRFGTNRFTNKGILMTLNPNGKLLISGGTGGPPVFDVAEHMKVEGPFEAGDAVVVKPDGSGVLVRSSVPSDPKVIGVISGSPLLALGREEIGPAIAMAGQVVVNASTENGPLRPGDLVVTASLPGHVMKAPAQPVPGTVVGKVLQGLESGTGKIRIVVMLR